MSKLEHLVEELSHLTVIEAAELSKMLEEKWGVSAMTPSIAATVPTMIQSAEDESPQEEQTEFTVILTSYGEKKINVIKEVRTITGLGLKEAKELVENTPKSLKESIAKEEAEKIKTQLEAVGASIKIE